MTIARVLPIALFTTLIGCVGSSGDDETVARSLSEVSISAADARLVLDLCNYPATDFGTLDEAVGLDRRAAEGIVAHRDGADGVSPSADDNPFDDVAELDAIPYVGQTAVAKLQRYAAAHPAPAAEQVEGVGFAGWQAEAVLWGVNQANVAELDVEVALDARAAANLVADAPFSSLAALGDVGYVGGSALENLRDHGTVWWHAMDGSTSEPGLAGTFDGVNFDEPTAATALEIANLATHTQLVEHGMWSQGATTLVDNRPYADLAVVAALSGVGTATMQALHEYASSGDWAAPSAGDEDCSTELAARSDADAADFDALLAAATTGDWPFAEVIALQVNSCVDMSQSNQRDSVLEHIIEQRVINWAIGSSPWQYLNGDDFERGASLFVSRMDTAKLAIEESVQDGWTPSTAAETDLLNRLDDIHTALTSGPRSQPSSYWVARLYINAAECSEDAAIVFDPATNHIWIVHQLPGC